MKKALTVVLAVLMLIMISVTSFASYPTAPIGETFTVNPPKNTIWEISDYMSGDNRKFVADETGCYIVKTTVVSAYPNADPVVDLYDAEEDYIGSNGEYAERGNEFCFYVKANETYYLSFYDWDGVEVSYEAYISEGCGDFDGDGLCDGCRAGDFEDIQIGEMFTVNPPENTVWDESEYYSGHNWSFVPDESGCYTVDTFVTDEYPDADPVVEVYGPDDMWLSNDDYYGVESALCFYAEAGEKYTISFYDYNGDEVSYEAYVSKCCGDYDYDGYCDGCGTRLCEHKCHDGGFVWSIINFFNRIFGINEQCDCGAYHW